MQGKPYLIVEEQEQRLIEQYVKSITKILSFYNIYTILNFFMIK